MAALHGDPLLKEAIPSRAYGKMLALIFCFIGMLGCTMLLSHRGQVATLEPSVSMVAHMQPAQVSKILVSLPGPSRLKNAAISAIEATKGRCLRRDVSVKAADQQPFSKAELENMAGVSAPFGLFDPWGIAARVPQGKLLFFREAELKHGRVCMLAILGLVMAENHVFIPLLGNDIPKDTPAYLLGTPFIVEKTVNQFWPLAILGLFAEELRHENDFKKDIYDGKRLPSDGLPGDYGWDPLGFRPKSAKELKELQTKELNNGRLAMFASLGIMAQEAVEHRNILR
jgi:hypothetical protein